MLKDFIEGEEGKKYKNEETNDLQEGYLYWSVREAMYKLGYYKDAKTSKEYNIKLANEINKLCDEKTIKSKPKRSSLIAPLYAECIEELYKYIPKAFYNEALYKNILVEIPNIKKAPKSFLNITRNKEIYNYEKDQININIMQIILILYKIINPILLISSIIFYIILMKRFFKKESRFENYKMIIFLNGILCIYLLRVGTVGYVAATEYYSAIEGKCQYLAASYPLQSMFSILSIYLFIEMRKGKDGKRVNNTYSSIK